MELRMIAHGMMAGFGFLVAVVLLETWATRPARPGTAVLRAEGDISEQVWQVLAEARRITEEAS